MPAVPAQSNRHLYPMLRTGYKCLDVSSFKHRNSLLLEVKMKNIGFCKIIVLSALCLSCSDDDNTKDTADSLAGVWQSEFNNIQYLIHESDSQVTLKSCNTDEPFSLLKSNGYLLAGDEEIYKINNSEEIELLVSDLQGIKLHRVNTNENFDSGTLSIESSNIDNLSATTDVCAYRETDGRFNVITAPYLQGFLQIVIDVGSKTIGNYSSPSDDISIYLESDQLPSLSLSGFTEDLEVIEYSDAKFGANFQFTTQDGNEYSGSVDVEL